QLSQVSGVRDAIAEMPRIPGAARPRPSAGDGRSLWYPYQDNAETVCLVPGVAKCRQINFPADGSRAMMQRIILVTGATDGVGRVVAKQLAADGAFVLAHGRSHERGESLVADIERNGGKARFYRADFAALAEVRGLADAITRDHDRLDALVNNAGI